MVNINEFVRLLNQIVAQFALAGDSAHHTLLTAADDELRTARRFRIVSAITVALRMLVVLTVLAGVLYPLAITAIAQLVFPTQANGSLTFVDEQVAGSWLIGQAMQDQRYFWPRPSAVNYMSGSQMDALGSSGATNYGPTNAQFAVQVQARAAAFHAANRLASDDVVPADMLSASGSGLDPHISPAAARLQINRVAEARGLDPTMLAALVERYVEGPQFGFLGNPRVNVFRLNQALDALQ